MKEYIKPELEVVDFTTEVVTVTMSTDDGVIGDEF